MQIYSDILVSVVMPVYNGALYLREAIDSILSQTHSNLELIIINDGSTDDSEKVILSYEDSRIRYIKNEKNSGICITLNKGLDLARGKYIARMDCDDISVSDRIKKQVIYLEQNPHIGVVGSDIIVFGSDIDARLFTFEHNKDSCKAGLLFNTSFAHPTVMMRKSLLQAYNFRYNDSYRGLEDFELWYRLSMYTELNNLSEPLLKYRKHKSQETQNVPPRVINKLKEFQIERLSVYGDFDADQMSLIYAYSRGDWETFDNSNFDLLYSVFVKIIKRCRLDHDISFVKGMQITLSKAIAYTLMNVENIKMSSRKVYTRALFDGVMPLDWYIKFIYHTIF